MNSGIYCYTNLVNDKKYIGQAQNLKKRIGRHESNFKSKEWETTSPRENKPLWQAIKKYGREYFSVDVLEFCDVDRLDEREIFYIKNLNSHFSGNGYNLTFGGNSMRGLIFTDESRQKMSKSHTGKSQSLSTVVARQEALIGKKKEYGKSQYYGVFPMKNGNKTYWISEIKERKQRLFTKCFSLETCAALFYDLEVLRLGLNRPLNFSDNERLSILESDAWKSTKQYNKEHKG